MSEDDKSYEVGRGRPPRHSRWRKGQSGNPRGRPKGARNFKSDLEEVLSSPVTINEGGRQKKVSVQLATLLRLGEKALKGDIRAMGKLMDLAKELSDERAGQQAERDLSAAEQDILDRFVERQIASAGRKGRDSADPDRGLHHE
jgi:hypothetical protein